MDREPGKGEGGRGVMKERGEGREGREEGERGKRGERKEEFSHV